MWIRNIRKGCAEEVRIKMSPEGWTGVTQDERKGMNNLDRGNNDCKDSKTCYSKTLVLLLHCAYIRRKPGHAEDIYRLRLTPESKDLASFIHTLLASNCTPRYILNRSSAHIYTKVDVQ